VLVEQVAARVGTVAFDGVPSPPGGFLNTGWKLFEEQCPRQISRNTGAVATAAAAAIAIAVAAAVAIVIVIAIAVAAFVIAIAIAATATPAIVIVIAIAATATVASLQIGPSLETRPAFQREACGHSGNVVLGT
jgi:hypothetical protein